MADVHTESSDYESEDVLLSSILEWWNIDNFYEGNIVKWVDNCRENDTSNQKIIQQESLIVIT